MRSTLVPSLLLCMAMRAAAFDGTIEVLAASGDTIPGTDETFVEFRTAAINESGDVALEVFLAEPPGPGGDGFPDSAIVVFRGGEAELVAREGDPAHGTPTGVEFLTLYRPRLDDFGRTVFEARLTGPDVTPANEYGVWRADEDGDVEILLRMGDPMPGGGPNGAFNTSMGATGHLAYQDEDVAIWGETATGARFEFARVGDPAPEAGADYEWVGFPLVNAAARAAFVAGLGPLDEGIFVIDGAGVQDLVARIGEPAPGASAPFSGLLLDALNEAGDVAFWGRPDAAGEPTGIWAPGAAGPVSLVAGTGDPAPGAPAGATFAGFGTDVVLDDAGRSTFRASLSPDGIPADARSGLWRSNGAGAVALVARTHDPLPEGAGRWYSDFFALATSGAGDLAFIAETYGPDPVERSAFVTVDPAGVSQTVTKTGDEIDVAPGDSRIVAGVHWSPEPYSGARGINAARQLPLFVLFEDDSQALVFVRVPEPAHVLLLAVGALVLAAARRR
jgi:hypothetical protein